MNDDCTWENCSDDSDCEPYERSYDCSYTTTESVINYFTDEILYQYKVEVERTCSRTIYPCDE